MFKRQNAVFEFRYKEISNFISYDSKPFILKEAKRQYYRLRKKKDIKIKSHSLWSATSFLLKQKEEALQLNFGICFERKHIQIPFYAYEKGMRYMEKFRPLFLKLYSYEGKWIAIIRMKGIPVSNKGIHSMGIDVGVKVPAVTALDTGQIRFFGNGRYLRFLQRKYRTHIKEMQKRKQIKKLKRFKHKLHHVQHDFDHKVSRQIIDYALEHQVGIIKMEYLTSINKKFEVKQYHNIYLWSYRRLQEFIAYKAELVGIKVEYVNPFLTSQKCPVCSKRNKAIGRIYKCRCGYHGHRDGVGALNILHARTLTRLESACSI